MSRVDLPSGGWAELADPETLSLGRRHKIEAATAKMMTPEMVSVITANPDLTETELGTKFVEAGVDVAGMMAGMFDNDVEAVLAFVTTWSFGDVISAEVLMDVQARDYDELKAAVEPLAGKLRLDTSPKTAGQDPGRVSPTSPLGV